MATRQVSIASSVGLHARPASLFVQAATATGLPVTIAKEGGNPVDARSILMVMALGAKNGETVTLSADGEGAARGRAVVVDDDGRRVVELEIRGISKERNLHDRRDQKHREHALVAPSLEQLLPDKREEGNPRDRALHATLR